MKKISLFIIAVLCIGMFFGCDYLFSNGNADGDKAPPEFYTVTFDSNGGTSVKSASVSKAG